MRKPVFTLTLILLFGACKQHQSVTDSRQKRQYTFPYNLQQPDKRYDLPGILKEISGIAAVNDSIVACIGDELGIVYFYNLNTNAIIRQLNFTDKGDFEDLTIIADTVYVLNSRGVIWSIKNYSSQQPQVNSYPLNIETPVELEGLCERENNLYIAAKYYHNKKRDTRGMLPVWKLLLSSMQVQKPLFSLPDFIKNSSGSFVPFDASALLFNNKTRKWYFISSHTKALLRCNESGHVIRQEILSSQEFSQPEGLCFTPSGDLLISNEGKDGSPTILLFSKK